MKNNNDYKLLFEKIGEKTIKQHIAFLIKASNEYINIMGLKGIIKVINRLLFETVVDYFTDLIRLKNFHCIEKVNPIKVASYTVTWIFRKKPLHLIIEPDDKILEKFPFILEINEWFCSHLLIGMTFDTRELLLQDHKTLKRWNEWRKMNS